MKKFPFLCAFFLPIAFLSAANAFPENIPSKERISTLANRLNLLRSEGLNALDVHNYRKAEQIFKEILSLSPEKWLDEKEYNEILIYLTRAEIQTKQYKEAEKHLSSLLEEGLNDAIVYNREALRAQIYFAKKEPLNAIRVLHCLMDQFSIQEWDLTDQKFYVRVKNQVDQYYEDLFTQAERCFQGAIYQETIPLYQEILSALESGDYRQDLNPRLPLEIRLRIAFCEFQQGHYEKSKNLLIEAKDKFAALFDSESFYQLIVSCRELGQYSEALQFCEEFLTFKYSTSKQDLVRFEMARIYFQQKENIESKKILESLIKEVKDPYYLALSRFYLAKIFIQEKQYKEVEKILHPDYFNFGPDDLLKYEWAFLRAEALYYRKQYEMAAAGFKEALAHPAIKNAQWYLDTLYNLGFCYLKIGEDHLIQEKSKEEFFHLAESTFKELLKAHDSDLARLALGRVYLLQYYYLKDPSAKENIHKLFKNYSFESLSTKLEAGFILADMTSDLNSREKIYHSLCSSLYEEAENYGKAWYYQGVFYSQMSALNHSQKSLEQAIESFKKSYSYLKNHYPNLASSAIKNMIKAYLNSENPSALYECYLFLEDFLKKEIETLKVKNASLDFGCLKAELCLRLMQKGEDSYFKKGIEAIENLSLNKEEIFDRAQFLMGRLYFQHKDYRKAKETFLNLVESKPKSSYVGDSWFWIAECQEIEGYDKALTKEYRKKVFEEHLESKLAAEAYFLYYSFAEYLEGHKEAISHLEKMSDLFKDSPYLITTHYLLGLNKKEDKKDVDGRLLEPKDLNASIAYFQKAKEYFLSFYDQEKIPKSNLAYFVSVYYKSILSNAQVYLEKADESLGAKRHVYLEKAIESFNEVYADFAADYHIFASILYEDENIPKILEEASFGRAIAFAKNGQIFDAEAALSEIIEQYANLKIERGHYLSRAWYELAMIAMAKQEYQEALDYYIHAENTLDSQSISGGQKIDLGIQQSLCYRFLGQLDMAMLTLSKVINEGVVSNLRVKAMVLRAEIYELQDRKELAQKQLEAASKKGGEWGRVAKEKLVKEYGVN